MEEPLQHAPRTKQAIKDLLYHYMYSNVEKQLNQVLNRIIEKNTLLLGVSHKSFTYKGVLHSSEISPPPRRLNQLDPRFKPEMENYLAEVRQLNTVELPYVLGFITHVLNASNDFQDYLRVFPEAVHQPLQALIASYPCRTKKLSDFDVECIQKKNQKSIDLMRQRMVTNLIT